MLIQPTSGMVMLLLCIALGDAPQTMRDYNLITEGRAATADQAKQWESSLQTAPDELDTRIKLIGYFSKQRYADKKASASRAEQVLWIIRNRPLSPICGTPNAYLHPHMEPEAFVDAKKAWIAHVEREPTNTTLLAHAAAFLLLNDPDKAEEYLKEGRKLEPDNAEWSARLGHLYSLSVNHPRPPNPERAQLALETYEAGLKKSSGVQRDLMLIDAANAAITAGQFAKAEEFGNEILKRADATDRWAQGNFQHQGNLILGHVALHKGDLDAAENFLLRAGETTGSPQLDSFGPNMFLAKKLLEAGRKEKVIAYLNACRKFWKNDRGKLDEWIKDIETGRVPDFGANLNY